MKNKIKVCDDLICEFKLLQKKLEQIQEKIWDNSELLGTSEVYFISQNIYYELDELFDILKQLKTETNNE